MMIKWSYVDKHNISDTRARSTHFIIAFSRTVRMFTLQTIHFVTPEIQQWLTPAIAASIINPGMTLVQMAIRVTRQGAQLRDPGNGLGRVYLH
jgi:hypothetical protein